MNTYRIYLLDIFFRTNYVLFSFSCCCVIFFCFVESLFLFESLPITHSLSHKRFIVTEVVHLFKIVWLFVITLSFLFLFPLVTHHLKYFFKSAWHFPQIKFYGDSLKLFNVIFILIYFSAHSYLLPEILKFFFCWEVVDEFSLLRVEPELSLLLYVIWTFSTKFLVSSCATSLCIFIFWISRSQPTRVLYYTALCWRKLIMFVMLLILFTAIPPDLFNQCLLTGLVFTFVETFFFFLCQKLFIKIKKI